MKLNETSIIVERSRNRNRGLEYCLDAHIHAVEHGLAGLWVGSSHRGDPDLYAFQHNS